jgi:hypothetical protein
LLAGKEDRQGERELRRKIAELEWTLGRKPSGFLLLRRSGAERRVGSGRC